MISAGDPGPIHSKRKAITALFPYAVLQVQDGQHRVFDMCLHAVRASKHKGLLWRHIRELPVTRLLNEESPISTKQAFIHMLPHLPWWKMDGHEDWVQQWAAAVPAVPYTDEISQSVVDTLLHTLNGSLQSHIPIGMWSWLRKSPSLPPVCAGRHFGGSAAAVEFVRSLGDIEILTAYLHLIWSEWEWQPGRRCLSGRNFASIQTGYQYTTCGMDALIREDLGGIGMGFHRKNLLQHLDHVLGQLELGLEYLQKYDPRTSEDLIRRRQGQYRELREILLEVDREAVDALVRKSSRSFIHFGLLNPYMQVKDPTQCLCVQSLLYFCSCMSGTFPMASLPYKSLLNIYPKFLV
jgi:hypothetical protein